MKKIETIWHHILTEAVTKGRFQHTQQELAHQFQYSLSTIYHALQVPSAMGAIRKTGKSFVLQDFKKLLYYWASVRALARDVLYAASVELPLREIEGRALPESIYGAYTAAKKIMGEPPADYSKVYFYLPSTSLPAFERRFPPSSKKRPANTFVLKMIPAMARYGPFTTLIQTFVDIWNLTDWYAHDFTQALEARIDALLSRARH